MFKKLILKSVQFTAAGFATTAVYYLLVSSESSYHRSQLDGFIRSLRNSTRAALILYQSVVDYKDSLKDIPYNTEEYHAERSRVHTRTANRILSLSQ